ncbi:vanadium-dependent haloperoxidase [Aridibaculum aurantiacum]|uniref:vanadium-dependent haloperoxidase n=1 Tax=Aridibaculum aurantiacum TaxID=2810307 RepID=UPI001A977D5D|nr:vanadium-dependent haloperoxidase [Aridibaculum aurantiacum]
MRKVLFLASVVLVVILFSCNKEIDKDPTRPVNPEVDLKMKSNNGFAENDMVMFWNEKAATVLNPGFTQPARTRVFARIQVAVHDALNSIKPKYEHYAFFERQKDADPDAAVASAAYWVMKRTTLVGNPPLDQWYTESLATIPDGQGKDLGMALGKRSADALIANRANDGFTQLIINSPNPPNGVNPGEYRSTLSAANWVPTQTLVANRNLPNWGTVMKPWVIQSNQQFRPAGPYGVNSAEYTVEFNEVKVKGARVGSTRTAEEEKIGKFWSENRPSFIWNNIVRKAIQNKKLDAWKTARLFALMHVSMAESISSQLNAGYHFYSWRPETAIRLAANDGNENTTGDPNWLPALSETPAFVTPRPVTGAGNWMLQIIIRS